MVELDHRLKSILIVGGGTAGWMAAAAMSRLLYGSDCSVTLVEAPDIPTVGVGEATIPPIRRFNELVGFDEDRLLSEARATFKLGIEFRDWFAKGHRYFHPFGIYGAQASARYAHQKWLRARSLGEDLPLDALSACTQAASGGQYGPAGTHPGDPLSTLTSAYHFDAALYGRALRDHAQSMGATRVEARIDAVNLAGETGHIQSVTLSDGRELTADFYIDCSGMRSLLLGDALSVPFNDWSHWLPCDRAVAAPTELPGELPPYTTSTARDAGWQWRIPLQHRMGNGYVYSSGFSDDDAAHEEFLAGLPEAKSLSEPRLLRFQPGRREVFWKKNCLAIGLSGGFMEPLESTSIHLIQTGLTKLIDYFPDRRFSSANIDAYNQLARDEFDSIRDFLILHYCATERRDTPFWRYVSSMPIPDTLAHRIDLFREFGRVPLRTVDLFTETSWVAVFLGQGVLPQAWDPLISNIDADTLRQDVREQSARIASAVKSLPKHAEYLRSRGARLDGGPGHSPSPNRSAIAFT